MKKKPYHYVESGLDNVFLDNGYRIDKDGVLFVEDIHGLHKAIGETLVFLNRKLKGKEIRFIRHYLDLSQKAFGHMLGVDYQSVLRWESGKTKITKTAERLLRGVFYEYLNANKRAVDIIDMLSDLDNGRESKDLTLSLKRGDGWAMKAA